MEKRRNEREWKEKRPGGRNGEERKGRKPFHTAREEGKMVGEGTHEELMKNNETYRQIALSQLSEEELGQEGGE